jgi:hypothetical protein
MTSKLRIIGKKLALLTAIVLLALFVTSDYSREANGGEAQGGKAREATEQAFDYSAYAQILDRYVDGGGMVDYAALKANRVELDGFASALGDLSPAVYAKWGEREKVAFWINAYNALTLRAIIDHYPIESSFVASLRFPKNSIRQISGVWDKLEFRVMGSAMTLDDIEHSRLRRDFNEPRIHVALVCAALGCPQLRAEPFTGTALDAQLDDQSSRLLRDPDKFRIDRAENEVFLSSIFKWFGHDFVRTHGVTDKFKGHAESERAVLNFAVGYLDRVDADYLRYGEYDIEYLDYDWSLNERN